MAKKKKSTTRSSAAGKPTKKKSTSKKSTTKKAGTKKVTKKKTTGKKVTKKAASKPVTKKTSSKKKSTKKPAATKKPTTKKVVKKGPTSSAKSSSAKAAASKPAKPAKTAPAEMTLEEALEQDWTQAKLRKVKTGLTKKDMQYFLNLLLEKRAEIVGNIQGMELTRSAALSDIAHMPLHMADVGSDNFEQEFTLGLMESERKILRDINDALIRMREGIYGVCLDSGRPINRARLEVKPWAKYCIEVARLREKRGW